MHVSAARLDVTDLRGRAVGFHVRCDDLDSPPLAFPADHGRRRAVAENRVALEVVLVEAE
ncbi:hypothetical protein D3C87_2035910 [compost metagenome]